MRARTVATGREQQKRLVFLCQQDVEGRRFYSGQFPSDLGVPKTSLLAREAET